MRVLQLITRLIVGGAQRHVLSLARWLRDEHGHDVTIACGPDIGPEGTLEPQARREGFVPVRMAALRREVHPLRDMRAGQEVCSVIRRIRPAVVHTHSAKAGILGRILARWERVPIVVHTCHGLPLWPGQPVLEALFFTGCERVAAQFASAHICVSEHVRRRMLALDLIRPEDGVVIPCGVDTAFWRRRRDRTAARARFGLGGGPVVVIVARLVAHKGHARAIEMARADPEIEWLFVGDGPLRAELERAAAGLRIRFAGLLDAEGVAQAFAAADACAVFSETEALGLAAVEAILSGTPVVALPTGGLAEIVEDGVTGILVRDVGRLAEEIRRAVAMRVPEEAVERLARRFDERVVAQRIARLYSEVAEAIPHGASAH